MTYKNYVNYLSYSICSKTFYNKAVSFFMTTLIKCSYEFFYDNTNIILFFNKTTYLLCSSIVQGTTIYLFWY